MSLTRSAWKRIESPLPDYPDFVSFYPEVNIAVSYTWLRRDDGKYHIWGCWYKEPADQVVRTALKGRTTWRRESYEIDHDTLIWNTESGCAKWERIDDSCIPEELIKTGTEYMSRLQELTPPAKDYDAWVQP